MFMTKENDNVLTSITYSSLNDMDCRKYSGNTMIYKNVDVNDGVTNQIINTKRISITFFVDKFSKTILGVKLSILMMLL